MVLLADMEIDDLKQSLPKVPQEMYDQIFDYVLTPTSETVPIDLNYKPPVQLQLDSATRATAATRLYNDTIFIVDDEPSMDASLQWPFSLPGTHIAEIRKMFYQNNRKAAGITWVDAIIRSYWDLDLLGTVTCLPDT